ncbi:MAG: response regulator [Proteobacteria bacterium]|nr:response regulator [Pseudomonadota bacterium]
MFLLPGMLALLLWEMGTRIDRPFPIWLAIGFAIASLLSLIHVAVTVEWSGSLAEIAAAKGFLRPATWPPAVHVLPIAVGSAVWMMHRGATGTLLYAVCVVGLGLAAFIAFQWLPTYTEPGLLGITRPALIGSPLLWFATGWMCWRFRAEDRMLTPMTLMAGILFIANMVMLYSRAPHDTLAMLAHLGRICGSLVLMLSLMHMASMDMLDRIRAERALAALNADLEQRVLARTAELESTNQALEGEITVRREAEGKAQAQLQRLNLLHQITRAIGERQDLGSIFQVVVRSVEDQLPVDFCCLCLYDPTDHVLVVSKVGAKSGHFALDLAMPEQARVPIDENGLSRCIRGQLVYEPDIIDVDFPFPQRLTKGGLRSLVIAPLQIESQVFGVLVAARVQALSFSSGECEFLRQLSEHVALASHQAQLFGALQQAYDDLRQTQQAVMQQERLRALGQMASGIAHDINNAMSPVALYTESLLETDTSLSPRARGYLEIIQRAVEDVAHTVARMREFYRQHEPQLTLSPVHLNQLIQQVKDLTRARWSDMPMQRGIVIRLVSELATDMPTILGVESEIREALINLIFNAVDAIPDGGTITLRSRSVAAADSSGPAHVQVDIVDNGVGMSDDTRRRCLEPFFTTKGERGTGLGLAMVYGVMRRHGAEIDIDSTPGEGTTMRLSFPVPVIPATAGAVPDVPYVIPQRLRLLLIDDDPLLLRSLRDTLEAEGHIVSVANDGQAGIDAFQNAHGQGNAFAVVFTDLGMPYVDGRKVAGAIKAISPATPVILLTGWGQQILSDKDIPAHVDRVLSKPPKLREIRDALAQCCRTQLG